MTRWRGSAACEALSDALPFARPERARGPPFMRAERRALIPCPVAMPPCERPPPPAPRRTLKAFSSSSRDASEPLSKRDVFIENPMIHCEKTQGAALTRIQGAKVSRTPCEIHAGQRARVRRTPGYLAFRLFVFMRERTLSCFVHEFAGTLLHAATAREYDSTMPTRERTLARAPSREPPRRNAPRQ